MNNTKKIKIGTISKKDIIVVIGTRFISIGCIVNNAFRIMYDQDEKKFINSCKYCGKQCKVRKIVDRYIKRGDPFNFDDLTVKPRKRKKRRKTKTKKI
jgi:hypothetical protein